MVDGNDGNQLDADGEQQRLYFRRRAIKARDRIFYIVGDETVTGDIDLNSEGHDCLTRGQALKRAMGICSFHGGVQWVIECKAVRRVTAFDTDLTDVLKNMRFDDKALPAMCEQLDMIEAGRDD